MGVHEKLYSIQTKLKAPKKQFNSFGKYNYRSLEDIFEAVKPYLESAKCTLKCSDEIVSYGDRNYIKVTATLTDVETGESVENTALAREAVDKKGMDDSQLTGATSSYARKYCLSGLFLLDDTKDADTNEFKEQTIEEETKEQASKEELEKFKQLCENQGLNSREIWNQTGKAKDYSKAHLGLAMKWLVDYENAKGKA